MRPRAIPMALPPKRAPPTPTPHDKSFTVPMTMLQREFQQLPYSFATQSSAACWLFDLQILAIASQRASVFVLHFPHDSRTHLSAQLSSSAGFALMPMGMFM